MAVRPIRPDVQPGALRLPLATPIAGFITPVAGFLAVEFDPRS